MVPHRTALHRITALLGLFFFTLLVVHCSPPEKKSSEPKQNKIQKAKEDVPELADAMGQLQAYTHKYALAVEAKNHELATFYFHEVRASADGIKENIPGYEGYDISRFMKMMMDPTIEPIETALANRDWEKVRKRTITMIDACNSCHNATSHGFIEITPGFDNNPYNQEFTAPE